MDDGNKKAKGDHLWVVVRSRGSISRWLAPKDLCTVKSLRKEKDLTTEYTNVKRPISIGFINDETFRHKHVYQCQQKKTVGIGPKTNRHNFFAPVDLYYWHIAVTTGVK